MLRVGLQKLEMNAGVMRCLTLTGVRSWWVDDTCSMMILTDTANTTVAADTAAAADDDDAGDPNSLQLQVN